MTFHFSPHLNPVSIESIKNQFGFPNRIPIERFIMDFEMQYHISQKLDCITRGGMCMPFHIRENIAVRRLSVDIDLFTNSPLEQIQQTMKQINDELTEVKIIQHEPKDSLPIPLVTYKANYRSCFGTDDFVKIDILYDTNIPLATQKISSGFELFAFKTDYDITILDHGTLMADKLTTLSLPPLGLEPGKHGDEIPKQLYDVGILLELAKKEDILRVYEDIQTLIKYKGKFLDSALTVEKALKNMNISLTSLMTTDNSIAMTTEQHTRHNNFTSNLLGNFAYTTTKHVCDILLVRLFCKHVLSILQGKLTIDKSAELLLEQIVELKSMSSADAGTRIEIKRNLLASFPQSAIKPQILKNTQVEYLFLLDKILN